MNNNKKVLVLGAGPTGMASALHLARSGKKVKIIERLPWVGGLSKTFERGPYKLDLGPHRFTPHNERVYRLVKDLIPDDLRVVQYKAEIWLDNKFVSYPFQLKNLLLKLSPWLSLQMTLTFALSSLRLKDAHEKIYEEWIVNHFGPVITKHIFRPLVEKVWATPLTQLSARFARQRIAATNLIEVAKEILSGKRSPQYQSPYYPDNCFLYPKYGFGTILDRMEEEIKKHGGEIEVDATVKKIDIEGGKITKVYYEKNGQLLSEEPEFVTSTIPIQYFFEIINPSVSQELLASSKRLKTRRLVLLYLVLNKDRFSENTSLYFPPNEFMFGRVWEQKNHSPDTIPTPGKTVLGLEIPCWEGDSTWTADDKSLMKRAIEPFIRHKILEESLIEDYFTVRLGSVYPVWEKDFESNLKPLLDYEKGIENLILNGRPGLFFYNNLHHSLEMGLLAADHIIANLPKSQKWNIDAKLFDEYRLVE